MKALSGHHKSKNLILFHLPELQTLQRLTKPSRGSGWWLGREDHGGWTELWDGGLPRSPCSDPTPRNVNSEDHLTLANKSQPDTYVEWNIWDK